MNVLSQVFVLGRTVVRLINNTAITGKSVNIAVSLAVFFNTDAKKYSIQ